MHKGAKHKHKAGKRYCGTKASAASSKHDRKSRKSGKQCTKINTEFARELEADGWYVNAMDGDGNCLFRSIADQFTDQPERHAEFRRRIVNYIKGNRDHFALFMEDDENFDRYIDRMAGDCEWGGHPELYAASQCLNVNIVVHQVDAPTYILQAANVKTNNGEIHLSYHGVCHYNSVRRLDPMVTHIDTGPTLEGNGSNRRKPRWQDSGKSIEEPAELTTSSIADLPVLEAAEIEDAEGVKPSGESNAIKIDDDPKCIAATCSPGSFTQEGIEDANAEKLEGESDVNDVAENGKPQSENLKDVIDSSKRFPKTKQKDQPVAAVGRPLSKRERRKLEKARASQPCPVPYIPHGGAQEHHLEDDAFVMHSLSSLSLTSHASSPSRSNNGAHARTEIVL